MTLRSSAPRWGLIAALCAIQIGCGAAGLGPRHGAQPADPASSPAADLPDFTALPVIRRGAEADMRFQRYGVNPTVETAASPTSSFSIDVSTAAYSMARAILSRGILPQEAAVRVEAFVNAFDYGEPPPRGGAILAAHGEAFPSPNRVGYHVLRITLRGRVIEDEARQPADLVFVIDVSSSMDRGDRLGRIKRALVYLVEQLGPEDTVAVVTYGSSAQVALPRTAAHHRAKIIEAIAAAAPEDGSHSEAALRLGYQLAAESAAPGRISRVTLCSDGLAIREAADLGALEAEIRRRGRAGISLSAIGVGVGRYDDALMTRLADLGQGRYLYVDTDEDARRAFVQGLTGDLEIIARDVKAQVRFNPEAVARYRLLGYERRLLSAEGFRRDAVDGGALGAGQEVTALYEIKLAGVGELGSLRVRYQPPEGGAVHELERSIERAWVQPSIEAASPQGRLAWIAAGFAEKLRGSYWARTIRYEALQVELARLPEPWRRRREVEELAALIERAAQVDRRGDRFEGERAIGHMEFDHVPVLSDVSPNSVHPDSVSPSDGR